MNIQTGALQGTTRGFREDLEGLRGVCVAAVVLFHAFPDAVPGGFVGVDVFFVLSGFLITRLMLEEAAKQGRVNLLAFWCRRIRRILPVASLVIVAITVGAWMIPDADARDIGRSLLAASLFVFNLQRAADRAEYLAADDEYDPVLHYWSLGVEEQFYAAWPLLVAAALAFRGRTSAATLGMLTVALLLGSLATCLYLSVNDPVMAFFGTHARIWQLLVGGGVAMLDLRRIGSLGAASHIAGIAALALLLASFFALDREGYPGAWALIPTLAAAFAIHVGADRRLVSSAILSGPVLRYLGRISFSLYLWHWPVLVFGALLFGRALPELLAMMAVSVGLAAATYHLYENPIRRNRWLAASPERTLALGAALVALTVSCALLVRYFGPDQVPLGDGTFISADAIKQDRPAIYGDRCLLRITDTAYGDCAFGDRVSSKTVVLFGDSHAANWFTPVNAAAEREGWRLLVRVKAACKPSDVPQRLTNGNPYPACQEWRDAVLAEIESLKPELVVVGSMSSKLPVDGEARVIARLAAAASEVVLMRDTPYLPETPAACLKRTSDALRCLWPVPQRKQSFPATPAADLQPNVRVLDLNERICEGGVCKAVVGRSVTFFDKHHLTSSFATRFTDDFAAILKVSSSRD
ncbi:acyltransferase family protein [Hyphomicrobium sp. CS1GBMeth3]|uniref:acyltransferase family protein n=1 Tax=Hyphomicrobium sp. CS1GBMeth3 TaxID=1892845 RepID=UPI00093041C1|nr:acyltransferase family protein [Hyphomicrobium sp. CS1GBMeth3]